MMLDLFRQGPSWRWLPAMVLIVMAALTACQQVPLPPVALPKTDIQRPPPPAEFNEQLPQDESVRTTRITPGPGARMVPAARPKPAPVQGGLTGQPVTASFDQMPLPAFVNTVFGELLKVNYQMDPAVAARQDLVTLRTGGARSPQELLNVAQEVLASYGLQVTRSDNVYRIVPNDVLMQQIPDLVRARALPDVPSDLRPVFQYFELQEARAGDVMQVLVNVIGQKVKAFAMPSANAILLFGLPQDMQTVARMMATLDRAYYGNNLSVRIDPVYWNAQPLAARLLEILKAQGYAATIGGQQNDVPISIIPVPQINAVLAFAPNQQTLDFIANWARQLDQPSGTEDNQKVFVYFVRNTKATGIADVVSAAIEGQSGSRSSGAGSGGGANQQGSAGLTPGSAATPQAAGLGAGASTSSSNASGQASSASRSGRLVVDEVRNALVFAGSAQEWSRYRPLIEQLDVPTREALIEVTVMEVTLTDNASLGVQALFTGGLNGYGFSVGTLDPAQAPAQQPGGMNIRVFNSADALRGALTALATNNRVSVLSNPRVLARSGAEAKIQIGQDVPIVSSQGQSTVGSSAVLQSIQYRQTGVVLSVKPIIHAGRRVDLEVSQEVSNIDKTLTSSVTGVSSAGFQNRKVTTQLALFDGATVILGGLIQDNRSLSDSGIPFLKDLPVIGQAFRTSGDDRTRTELVVVITPYIISGPDDIQAITDAYVNRIQRTGNDNKINLPLLPQYYKPN